jgi:PAP2 superfamily
VDALLVTASARYHRVVISDAGGAMRWRWWLPVTGAVLALAAVMMWLPASPALAGIAAVKGRPDQVVRTWYGVMLELTRHTATYTPPVASRTFGYVGVTAYEATASGNSKLHSLAGQLNGLTALPKRDEGVVYDEAVVMQAALNGVMQALFANTGPTGQRVLGVVQRKLDAAVTEGVSEPVAARSVAHGRAIAAHVLRWSQGDGGAVVENMGFPLEYALNKAPGHWVPTSLVVQQQKPLLPKWGGNRPFAMPMAASCPLPAPPAYSEDPASEFHKQAKEVFDLSKSLTPEQKAIARFWSDDPMLSTTPPGHWLSIGLQLSERDGFATDQLVDMLARLGITQADAFIGCWNTKYQFDLLRPVTYIKKAFDKTWASLLTTPPFPEYPSGHSTQSAASAAVLTALFGDVAFEDTTGVKDGLKPRKFVSFAAAAEEAGISRLYGGIHFRAAIDRGLDQGRCIGAYAAALKTRE